MDLILWRHAEAEELAEGQDDPSRGLTPKGERHARRMAEWLHTVLPETTRILVSPALRTRQTADALERKYKLVDALSHEGTVDGLLAAARWPDAREPVLIVGHQPTLGLAAAYLMTGPRLIAGHEQEMVPWSIRKGGVWWLRHRPKEERGEVVLVTVRSPELL
ncbi:MAG: histidine phosphatase family protein [Burkholderiales bacterium]|jgi:phosphohistidine phosphatase|uniref:SixA phosphatase family protein n=1 Tax=Ideonella sp. TaxID=1929293 RepID=UPI0035AF7A74|nr:histidine phosphatase family protein [Burkholderiales bacterium]